MWEKAEGNVTSHLYYIISLLIFLALNKLMMAKLVAYTQEGKHMQKGIFSVKVSWAGKFRKQADNNPIEKENH